MKYRTDIDVLRAVSVMSVIVYHASPASLPGGFVGVDLFFVISGFLITGQIAAEVTSGSFSLMEFYRRRVKRIAPVLLVVTGVTVLACHVLMRPVDAEAVARSAVWSLASLANVFFWLSNDSSYFATTSDQVPLLHLWSLGVEEQFYMLWPLVLMLFAAAISRPRFLLMLTIVALASYLLAEFTYPIDPSFTYYMLPTRIGELLLGALGALIVRYDSITKRLAQWSTPMGLVGSALIAASLLLVSSSRVFPGLQALAPTIGGAMLLVAGHNKPLSLFGFYKNPILAFVGKISYSAYLWHWPIFALLRYTNIEVGLAAGSAAIVLTLTLATLTYYLVETPTRRTQKGLLHVFMSHFAVPGSIIGVFCLFSLLQDGATLKPLIPNYARNLAALGEPIRPPYTYDYVCQQQRLDIDSFDRETCLIGDQSNKRPRAVLFGDSNAAHYVGAFDEIGKKSGIAIYNVEVGACPPVFNELDQFVDRKRIDGCIASMALARSKLLDYETIILAANWSYYADRSGQLFELLGDALDELSAAQKTIILVGKAPVLKHFDRYCAEKAVSNRLMNCKVEPVPLDPSIASTNRKLQSIAQQRANVFYMDFNDLLCSDGSCKVNWSDGTSIFFDRSHLSIETSRRLGQIMIEKGLLPTFLLSADLPTH